VAVSVETSSVGLVGNATWTVLAVPFPFQDEDQLTVTSTVTATGVVTTLSSGFTVAIVNDAYGIPASGTVTFDTAPAATVTINVTRNVDYKQPTSFRQQGSFSPSVHERALDLLTFMAQQLDRRLQVVEGLGDLVPASSYTAADMDVTFTTHATAIESTSWPTITVAVGTVVTACFVGRVQNVTAPTSVDYAQVVQVIKITPSANSATLIFSGLDLGTEYTISLEVHSE
jgi:hypothetical protein